MASETQSSIHDLENRLSRSPDSLAFSRLADSYRKRGDIGQAITVCTEGLQRHPECVTGHIILGRCFLEQEKLQEAMKEFSDVCRRDRRNLIAIKMMADIFSRQGMEEKAGDLYAILLKMDPENQSLVQLSANFKGTGKSGLFEILGIQQLAPAATPAEKNSVALDTVIESPSSEQEPVSGAVEPESLGIASAEELDTLAADTPAEEAIQATVQGSSEPSAESLTGEDVSNRMSAMFEEGPDVSVPAIADDFASTGQGDDLAETLKSSVPEEENEIARSIQTAETMPIPPKALSDAVSQPVNDLASRVDDLFAEESPAAAAQPASEQESFAVEEDLLMPSDNAIVEKTVREPESPEPLIVAAEEPEAMSEARPELDEVKPEGASVSGEDVSERIREIFKEESSEPVPAAQEPQPAGAIDMEEPAAVPGAVFEEPPIAPRTSAPEDMERLERTQAIGRDELFAVKDQDLSVHPNDDSLTDTIVTEMEEQVPEQKAADAILIDDRADYELTVTSAVDFSSDLIDTPAALSKPEADDDVSEQTISMDRSELYREPAAPLATPQPSAMADLYDIDAVIPETPETQIPTGDEVVDTLAAVFERGDLPEQTSDAAAPALPVAEELREEPSDALDRDTRQLRAGTLEPVADSVHEASAEAGSDSAVDGLAVADRLDEMFPDDALLATAVASLVPDEEEETPPDLPQGFYNVAGEAAGPSATGGEVFDKLQDTHEFELQDVAVEPPAAIEPGKTSDLVSDQTAEQSLAEHMPGPDLEDVVVDESVPTIDGDDVAARIGQLFPADPLDEESLQTIPEDSGDKDEVVGGGFYTLTGEDAAVATADDPLVDKIDTDTPAAAEPVIMDTVAPEEEANAAIDIFETPDEAAEPDPATRPASVHGPEEGLDQTKAEAFSIPDHVLTPTLADIYYQQGQPHLALQIYKRIFERDPDNARLQKRISEIEEAIASGTFEQAQSIKPEEPRPARQAVKKSTAAPSRTAASGKPLKGIKLSKTQRDKLRKRR
jgi:hypothetical protein